MLKNDYQPTGYARKSLRKGNAEKEYFFLGASKQYTPLGKQVHNLNLVIYYLYYLLSYISHIMILSGTKLVDITNEMKLPTKNISILLLAIIKT